MLGHSSGLPTSADSHASSVPILSGPLTADPTIALRIPADPPFLAVARLFGGSVASTFGLDPERTEDLRLALSEICAGAVIEDDGAARSDVGAIDIEVSWDEDALHFSCVPAPDVSDEHRWMLIRALLPDVHVGDGTPAGVSFSIDR
jgi:hypothetical protein